MVFVDVKHYVYLLTYLIATCRLAVDVASLTDVTRFGC